MSYRTFLSLLACATMPSSLGHPPAPTRRPAAVDRIEDRGATRSCEVGGQQLGAGRRGRRRGRHGEPEDAAAARVRVDADLAAVPGDDAAADGEPEARTRIAVRGRGAVERREDAGAVL